MCLGHSPTCGWCLFPPPLALGLAVWFALTKSMWQNWPCLPEPKPQLALRLLPSLSYNVAHHVIKLLYLNQKHKAENGGLPPPAAPATKCAWSHLGPLSSADPPADCSFRSKPSPLGVGPAGELPGQSTETKNRCLKPLNLKVLCYAAPDSWYTP